jgi:hypothetical protein
MIPAIFYFYQFKTWMTLDNFDKTVINTAKSFGKNPNIKYNVFSDSQVNGNCNTSSSTILFKSGISKDHLKVIEKQIDGLNWGFGDIKPWTRTEQSDAMKKADSVSKMTTRWE